MNGRVYDPRLGRFLQADPFAQAATNTQNVNRYSYVLNNPLNAVDPSGYFLGKLFRAINKLLGDFAPFAAIAVAIWLPGALAGLEGIWATASGTASLLSAVASGFIAGGISTGTLKGAFMGAFSAGMFYGIGSSFQEGGWAREFFGSAARGAKVVAHGLAGGVMSVLNGGKFGNGFASAGFTQLVAPGISGINKGTRFSPGRVFAAAVVGGTASAMTGGKFVNGAVTGAFSRAMNDESHWQKLKTQSQKMAKESAQWMKDNFRNVLTAAGGVGQVTGGAAMCLTGAGCLPGSFLMAHGANNIYEGVTGEDGWLRKGYQNVGEFITGDSRSGDFAYGVLEVGMSIHGSIKLVLKADSWKLFRNIPSDYERAYKSIGNKSLLFDTSVDEVTVEDTYNRTQRK